MQLSLEEIKNITTGAVRVKEEQGYFRFYRFTEREELLYKKWNQGSYVRTFTTAGVKLTFRTDSSKVKLKVLIEACMTRTFFSFDVFVNGKPIGYLDNFSNAVFMEDYTSQKFLDGEFSKTFDLGEGVKTVCIHFPWSVIVKLEEMWIEDNAFIEPVKPERKLLLYGDSITHGADTLRPSERYGAKLAESLQAEELNKGIGGEVFFPELVARKETEVADYITVAYGTNDLGKDEESFHIRCKIFYELVSAAYPKVPIFAMTPIWIRGQEDNPERLEKYNQMAEYIRQVVEPLGNVYLIDGVDLVPHVEMYYGDHWVHPNDAGNKKFFENLYPKILEVIT